MARLHIGTLAHWHIGTLEQYWAIWKIEETEEELLAMLPHPEAYREEVSRFSAPQRRIEWLAVRVLLRTMLNAEKQIAYHPNGKPYLADGSASISISHTKGYVAIILGKAGQEVGIDIERYGERVKRVASKFMRKDEQPAPFHGTDTWSLLLHWSAKETVFKCLNTAEVDFQAHIRIHPFTPQEAGTLTAEEFRTPNHHLFTIHYLLHPDFVLTLFE